jgi:hypothetical protein
MPWKSLVTDDQIVAKGTLDQLGRAEGCLAGLGNLKQLSEAAGTKSAELGRSPRRALRQRLLWTCTPRQISQALISRPRQTSVQPTRHF